MKIFPDTKVFVPCPANVATGGPELCHQFASTLISFGVSACMMYYPMANTNANAEDPVHDAYKKYHVPWNLHSIEDKPHNVIVVPEAITDFLYVGKKIQRVLWWMSVDNYLINIMTFIKRYLANPLCEPLKKKFFFHAADDDIIHFVQSEYARQFVKLNGIADDKIFMVEDYLNQAFLSRAANVDLTAKKNFVAYNPRKGFKITQQLIKLAPDIDWRPIKNMTAAQVQELLAQSKVYIDFGNHPGKDRIPRESAVSGCVVLVGKRGSAANDIDINIPAAFKFDMKTATLNAVVKKIREVFADFDAAHAAQADYRARILDDKNRFTNEVAAAFGIKKFPPPSIAFVHADGDEKNFLLAEEFSRRKDFGTCFIVDDVMAETKIADELIVRQQHRNYMRFGDKLVEFLTRDDARFLYREGRIKKFALLEPTEAELAELNDFYAPNAEDVLNVERISSD